jgi:membrane associated rhomboid family serine protease
MSDPPVEAAPRREPFLKLPAVIAWLLVAMILVHLRLVFSNEATQLRIIEDFGFVPARYSHLGTVHGSTSLLSLAWPFVTHLFVHGSWLHLGANGLWLMAVGAPLARRFGVAPFLAFYFVCGILSAATHLAANIGSPIPVVGASGAISGCMAGALRVLLSPSARYFVAKHPGVGQLAPLTDGRIILVAIIWTVTNALMGAGFFPVPGMGSAGIAWQAHIGGFFAGLFLMPLFDLWAGGSTKVFPNIRS